MVRIVDFYFDEPLVDVKRVDVIRYIQRSAPVPDLEATVFHTILIDLTKDESWLLANVRNNTRYEIVRAGDRDQLEYEYWRSPAGEALKKFCDFYDRSARLKRRAPVSRARFRALDRAGVLDLSVVRQNGEDLVWHAHYVGQQRARLLETASLFRATDNPERRKLVGRANRYHHWRDMMRLKPNGILVYDFGGYMPGATDPEKAGINRFKEGFGGRRVENYMSRRAVTLCGRIALWFLDRATTLNGWVRSWLLVGARFRVRLSE
jgi:hypothetical protein